MPRSSKQVIQWVNDPRDAGTPWFNLIVNVELPSLDRTWDRRGDFSRVDRKRLDEELKNKLDILWNNYVVIRGEENVWPRTMASNKKLILDITHVAVGKHLANIMAISQAVLVARGDVWPWSRSHVKKFTLQTHRLAKEDKPLLRHQRSSYLSIQVRRAMAKVLL